MKPVCNLDNLIQKYKNKASPPGDSARIREGVFVSMAPKKKPSGFTDGCKVEEKVFVSLQKKGD